MEINMDFLLFVDPKSSRFAVEMEFSSKLWEKFVMMEIFLMEMDAIIFAKSKAAGSA